MPNETDIQIGKNLTELRGDVSMDLLAAKMRDKGNAWNKSTISKIEHGERQLRLAEAVDVIECLGLSVHDNLPRLVSSGIDNRFNQEIVASKNLIEDIFDSCVALVFHIRWLDTELMKDDNDLPHGEHWARASKAIRERADAISNYVSCGRFLQAISNTLHSGEVVLSDGRYFESSNYRSILDMELVDVDEDSARK